MRQINRTHHGDIKMLNNIIRFDLLEEDSIRVSNKSGIRLRHRGRGTLNPHNERFMCFCLPRKRSKRSRHIVLSWRQFLSRLKAKNIKINFSSFSERRRGEGAPKTLRILFPRVATGAVIAVEMVEATEEILILWDGFLRALMDKVNSTSSSIMEGEAEEDFSAGACAGIPTTTPCWRVELSLENFGEFEQRREILEFPFVIKFPSSRSIPPCRRK
jgi:hypothetical protein